MICRSRNSFASVKKCCIMQIIFDKQSTIVSTVISVIDQMFSSTVVQVQAFYCQMHRTTQGQTGH